MPLTDKSCSKHIISKQGEWLALQLKLKLDSPGQIQSDENFPSSHAVQVAH
jgi:hypothetical protein